MAASEKPFSTAVFRDCNDFFLSPHRWIEVEPMLFVREDGRARIAFQTDKSGIVKYLYSSGFWVFERVD
jgi:hypothetical protein